MKLMAGSLPHTNGQFLTFPENHQEWELRTWWGCTDGAEWIRMHYVHMQSWNVQTQYYKRHIWKRTGSFDCTSVVLCVCVCMCKWRKWDIQHDRNPTWGRTNIAPCWWNPANNVRAVLRWAERATLLCYWKLRKRAVRNLRDYRSAGSSITATSSGSETIPASHADTERCLVEAPRR